MLVGSRWWFSIRWGWRPKPPGSSRRPNRWLGKKLTEAEPPFAGGYLQILSSGKHGRSFPRATNSHQNASRDLGWCVSTLTPNDKL